MTAGDHIRYKKETRVWYRLSQRLIPSQMTFIEEKNKFFSPTFRIFPIVVVGTDTDFPLFQEIDYLKGAAIALVDDVSLHFLYLFFIRYLPRPTNSIKPLSRRNWSCWRIFGWMLLFWGCFALRYPSNA